jgi:hypothetical protein
MKSVRGLVAERAEPWLTSTGIFRGFLRVADATVALALLPDAAADLFCFGGAFARFDRLPFKAGRADFFRSRLWAGSPGGPWLRDLAIDGVDLFNRITLLWCQIYFRSSWQAMVDLKLRSSDQEPEARTFKIARVRVQRELCGT